MPYSLITRAAFCYPVLVAVVAPTAAHGQTGAVAPNLDQVVAIALRQNPDILGARLRTDSARAEQRIARAVPDPSAAISPQNPYQYSLTELIDIGPRRTYRTRAAGQGFAAAQLDVADVTRQTLFGVRQAFYDVLLAEAQHRLAGEQRDIFRQVLAADSVRLRSGDVAQRDVTKAELESSRAEADVARSVAALHTARLTLQLLMGRPTPDTAFAITGELAFRPVAVPEDSLAAIAIRNRPDIRAADQRVNQSAALRSLAGSLWLPEPAVSAVYQSQPFGNGSYVNFGVGFVVPFPYAYGGERDRARVGVDAALLESRRRRSLAMNDVAEAVDSYQSAGGLAARYEGGLLAKAQTVLETARYAYNTGAASLLELQDAIQLYAATRTEYYTAVHDYWIGVFALGRALGQDIQ